MSMVQVIRLSFYVAVIAAASLFTYALLMRDGVITEVHSGVRVDAKLKPIGFAPIGQTRQVCFQFKNDTAYTVHLVGQGYSCYQNACISAQGLPAVLSPYCTYNLTVNIDARRPGKFMEKFMIYVAEQGMKRIDLYVAGEAVEPNPESAIFRPVL